MGFSPIALPVDQTQIDQLNVMLAELYGRGQTLMKTIAWADAKPVTYNSETYKLITLPLVPVGKWAFFGNCLLQTAAGVILHGKHVDIGINDGIDTVPADGSTNADHIPLPAGDAIATLAGPRFFTLSQPTDVHLHIASTWSPSNGSVTACGALWGFKITE